MLRCYVVDVHVVVSFEMRPERRCRPCRPVPVLASLDLVFAERAYSVTGILFFREVSPNGRLLPFIWCRH
jgi:hypothetical protein